MISRLAYSIAVGAALVGAQDAAQPDRRGSVEPPIVGRYTGSAIKDQSVKAFDRTQLAIRFGAQGKFEGPTIEGRRIWTALQGPKGRSGFEAFSNYQRAIAAQGFTTLYTCSREKCPRGLFFEGVGGELARALSVFGDGSLDDGHYLAASRSTPAGVEYVRLAVRGPTLPVTILDIGQPAAMESRVKIVEAGEMASQIEQRGRVALYAIEFDFDSAVIKPASKPQLDAVARYLTTNPSISVHVVGHTDGKGTVQYNNDLSGRRAAPIVAALGKDYGIPANRLGAYGVGELAPVASNDTEEGRAQNRRVEILKRID